MLKRPTAALALLAIAAIAAPVAAPLAAPTTDAYLRDLVAWRAKADASLRKDRGWLTLVGRHVLRYGANSVGSATGNDVVLDAAIAPARLGTIHVGERHVRLVLADGVSMHPADSPSRRFRGERALGTDAGNGDWIAEGRLAFQVIRRDDGRRCCASPTAPRSSARSSRAACGTNRRASSWSLRRSSRPPRTNGSRSSTS